MQIRSIQARNFRGFDNFELNLDSTFTLLVGGNGSGKTSALSALSVALGIWHTSKKGTGWRKIEPHEIRLVPKILGDRPSFEKCEPVSVTATGTVFGSECSWTRTIHQGGKNTVNVDADDLKQHLRGIDDFAEAFSMPLPVLAYYGAGRSWMASNERTKSDITNGHKPSRWDAYYGCLNEKIRMKDLMNWFVLESAARDSDGKFRRGFETVRYALKNCIPDATDVWFDHVYLEPVIKIGGTDYLFSNLSDGQKSMASLVADIAIKAVTLNSCLLDTEPSDSSDALPLILAETPGVVLIDELDVHLHPKWQRTVAADLIQTFPKLQFICTSHSPQIIGELNASQVVALDNGNAFKLPRAFGLDSSRVLEELMGAPARNQETEAMLSEIARLIDEEKLDEAKSRIEELAVRIGNEDPEITRFDIMMKFLESTVTE